jgi:hypothetical protein
MTTITATTAELVYAATGKKSTADLSTAAKAAIKLIKAGWSFNVTDTGLTVYRATLRYIGHYETEGFSARVLAELIAKRHIAGRAKTPAELREEEIDRAVAEWQASQY